MHRHGFIVQFSFAACIAASMGLSASAPGAADADGDGWPDTPKEVLFDKGGEMPPEEGGIAGTPPNDDCQSAIAIVVPSFTPGSTIGASTDPGFAVCGNAQARGVWYSVIGTGRRIRATTCPDGGGIAGYDSWISVYCGSCEGTICIAENDDSCVVVGQSLSSSVTWCSEPGVEYLIRVHGFASSSGTFFLAVTDAGVCTPTPVCPQASLEACCFPAGACDELPRAACLEAGGLPQGEDTDCKWAVCLPVNDDCRAAIHLNLPTTAHGSTVHAFPDVDLASCGNTHAPGVWYSVIGNGRVIRASTCAAEGGSASYDSWISVYCGDCDSHTCIVENDDAGGPCGNQSRVQWCSEHGARYLIRVHGYGSSAGDFSLRLTVGPFCLPEVLCRQACCLLSLNGECLDAPPFQCLVIGGIPLGHNTSCNDADVSCPDLRGACCYPDGSCLEIHPVTCFSTCGDFQGLWTECETAKCAQPAMGDADYDGDVDVFDVLEVLNNWGPCTFDGDFCQDNPCAADFNENSQIEIQDLLIVLDAWG